MPFSPEAQLETFAACVSNHGNSVFQLTNSRLDWLQSDWVAGNALSQPLVLHFYAFRSLFQVKTSRDTGSRLVGDQHSSRRCRRGDSEEGRKGGLLRFLVSGAISSLLRFPETKNDPYKNSLAFKRIRNMSGKCFSITHNDRGVTGRVTAFCEAEDKLVEMYFISFTWTPF